MRNDKLIPGLILVMIGAIFLLNNFDVIDFHWSNLFHLWPIFLVIGGVNLVFAHNRSPWATILKISVVVAGFALLLFGNHSTRYRWWPHYTYNNNDNSSNDDGDDNDDDDGDNTTGIKKIEGNSTFTEPYNASTRVARLNISGGGATYNLNDTTNQLFTANTKEFFGKYQYDHRQEDSVYVMDFTMKDNKGGHFNWGDNKSNTANLKLNVNPEWEINVETGASKIDFDLSKYKLKSLVLKGGAASFFAKIGQPLAATNVEVSTGVSEVTIEIPQNAACRIKTDSGLSSTSFDGFTKKDDGDYETAGFDAAKNKIYIHMSG
ncbi:MAG: LiaI-LiaF-like domain-containing protein, partial [Mucilaginibacter sp.]